MPAMGLAEQIARVRLKARGAEINARHRRAKERSARTQAAMAAPAPIDGVHPSFAQHLDAARARAKKATELAESKPRTADRIEQLVREGKLPPRTGDLGVGYEPTAEEVLGDWAEPTNPDGTEELPDAATVLAGDAPEAPPGWGDPPKPAASAAPQDPGTSPALASPPRAGQSKRKRGT